MHTATHVVFINALAWLFLAGAAFYFFRLICPRYLKAVNGYYDWENEFWHGACLLGMVACLAPPLMPVSNWLWVILFPIGVIWYFIRAYTYGLQLPYNKQWYDLAHAGMLFGMWWMFVEPIKHWLVTVVFVAYWCWFAGYYVWRVCQDFRKPHWLSFGQDIAHLAMGVVMIGMILFASVFMPAHGHVSVAAQANVVITEDNNFQMEVLNHKGTVALLIFGGCENCSKEAAIFNTVCRKLSPSLPIKFARVNKDDSPQTCDRMKIKDCPQVLLIYNGQVVDILKGFADEQELVAFLKQHASSLD